MITVKEFLDRGYRFVDGDIYSCKRGRKLVVGINASEETCNKRFEEDEYAHVVSAKALRD